VRLFVNRAIMVYALFTCMYFIHLHIKICHMLLKFNIIFKLIICVLQNDCIQNAFKKIKLSLCRIPQYKVLVAFWLCD